MNLGLNFLVEVEVGVEFENFEHADDVDVEIGVEVEFKAEVEFEADFGR